MPTSEPGEVLRLSDGRLLGYAQYGDPNGKPVLFFHGYPGSRLQRNPDDAITQSLGVRLIGIDRPGIGLSSYQLHRRLLDWPNDVVELADFLDIPRFAVLGYSFGGAYAAACAYKIPQRLTAVGIASGIAPLVGPDAPPHIPAQLRRLLFISRYLPQVLGSLLWVASTQIRTNPELVFRAVTKVEASASDKSVMLEPEIKAMLIENAVEVYRQGVRGLYEDGMVPCHPWGFRVANISVPVHLFYGEDDTIIPAAFGRHLEELLPHATARYYPRAGHLLVFTIWDEVLGELAT